MAWVTRAPAKINLDLRICGSRPDGYHLVRTRLQSIALADRLTLHATSGPFALACDAPGVPTDASNLAWGGASAMAKALNRPLEGLRLHLEKAVPAEAGLGGGSADAVAAARLVAAAAGVVIDTSTLAEVVRPLGADVAYFAVGGTVLGEGIGDRLTPLTDEPESAIVLVRPPFGVSTRDAYAWHDEHAPGGRPDDEWGNDLERPVAVRHPEVRRIVERLRASGASLAAMSGSGSACFGVFEPSADLAPLQHGWPEGTRVWVTHSLSRARYAAVTAVTEVL
jgi:4-diphosphocytidyl-2-C-methyl-D-erythritol kinase